MKPQQLIRSQLDHQLWKQVDRSPLYDQLDEQLDDHFWGEVFNDLHFQFLNSLGV